LKYFIQHCFICRPSDYTVTVETRNETRNEPRTVVTLALVIRSNRSARSQDLIHTRLISWQDGLYVRQPNSFPTNRYPKNAGIIHFMIRWLGVSQEGLRPACAKLWRIFSSHKSLSASRKQGSRRDILQRIEGIRGILF